eukprot:956246-Prorocentrum_minimum.AAC.3
MDSAVAFFASCRREALGEARRGTPVGCLGALGGRSWCTAEWARRRLRPPTACRMDSAWRTRAAWWDHGRWDHPPGGG